MSLRITGQIQIQNAITNLRSSSTKEALLQNQISSGIQVTQASDNPVTYADIVRGKSASARYGTYLQSITSASGDIEANVSALTETNQLLNQASTLASEGINSTTDSSNYTALATQVDSIISRVVQLANTQINGKYLFSGTSTTTQPFVVTNTNTNGQPLTITYQGSGNSVQALVSQGHTVDTRIPGSGVFLQNGNDVFKTLITLRDNLQNASANPTGAAATLTTSMSQIQSATTAVGNVLAAQASTSANLDSITSRIQNLKLDADSQTGALEGTDYTSAVLQLKQQDQAFQATLAVSAKLLQPSLLNFIQ